MAVKKVVEHKHTHVFKRRYTSPKVEVRKKKYSSPLMTYSHSNKYDLSQGFDKPKKSWSFAGWGAVGALILAVFLFVVVNSKITGKPYVGLGYWLEVFQDMPITFNLNNMYTLIPPVDFPDWLVFAEVPINFVLTVFNLFAGSVAVLQNVVNMLLYFVSKLVLFIAG